MGLLDYHSRNAPPKRRLTWWQLLLSLLPLMMGVASVVFPGETFGGSEAVLISIHVTDGVTGKPVPNAAVQSHGPFLVISQATVTDAAGVGTLHAVIGAAGFRKPFVYTSKLYVGSPITVMAQGYTDRVLVHEFGQVVTIFGNGGGPKTKIEVTLDRQQPATNPG